MGAISAIPSAPLKEAKVMPKKHSDKIYKLLRERILNEL